MINKQKGYTEANSMRELIRDNIHILPVISRFDIAFGFGDNPVGKVCADNNVDTDTFLCVCNLLSGYRYDVSQISLPSLMAYLQRAHSSFFDVAFPRIRHNLIDAINYSPSNEAALLLIKFFDDYVLEVKRHMEYENDVIFKYVSALLNRQNDESFCIANFSVNHTHMAAKLNELKDIFIYHYKQKENARLSSALFDVINCERDMMSHFEIESALFVPAVETLENNLRTMSSEAVADEDDADSRSSLLYSLSEREKDIVRGVAQGKANKEIADELCISVHTVATHRRNISSKLGIHSPAGLAIFAIINKLVDITEVHPH